MAVTVILDMSIKPEYADAVLEQLKGSLPDTRAFEGCLSVDVVRDQGDAGHIALIERWRERADQERYIKWRQEQGSMAAMADISTAPIRFSFFDELTDI